MTIMRIEINPQRNIWQSLTARVQRSDADIEARVSDILSQVRTGGDAAIRQLALQIDGYEPEQLQVSKREFSGAYAAVGPDVRAAIRHAARNIKAFHAAQRFEEVKVETQPGVVCVQRAVPISTVGLYIPGGTAPLFSTVLMLAIPARLAGCKRVVMCTPADKEGLVSAEVLEAARLCDVDAVYKIGGAQAIAAMAYGTESVPRVDKIFGPGNRYVTKAKQQVSCQGVAIDMVAGPSEVLVIADSTANPRYVAADLLSQAEHGADSQVVLVCTSEEFARRALAELKVQLACLSRRDIADKALEESSVIVLPSIDDCIDFSNLYAPEHLILAVADPWKAAARVTAAGSVFIGHYSPESAGDYASGTNHTLPTSGTARACSGVNLDSYMRKITYQELTRDGLASLGSTIVTMAEAEGLEAHAQAVKVRLEK